MRRVFLDTVGLVALWNKSDQWHTTASIAMQGLLANNIELYCSESIMLECGNAASRTSLRSEVVCFRSEIIAAGYMLRSSGEEIEMAWRAYNNHKGAGAGIVDQISFILMRRAGITEAFTNDQHFHAAGFMTLF